MNSESIPVIVLLGIGAVSMLFVVWLITFPLRDHLVSRAYQSILIAKVLRFTMCSGGMALLIWPPPLAWQRTIALSWFTTLSLGCMFSAMGWYLYSKDAIAMAKALKDYKVVDSLPVTTNTLNVAKEVTTKEPKPKEIKAKEVKPKDG